MKNQIIVLIALFLLAACGGGTPKKVTINNKKFLNLQQKNAEVGDDKITVKVGAKLNFPIGCDVHVIANGVDYGIIEAGQSKEMEVTNASSIKFDKFEMQKNAEGQCLYYTHNGNKFYVDLDGDPNWADSNLKQKSRAQFYSNPAETVKMVKAKTFSTPLMQESVEVEIGYGEVSWKELYKKKKKK